MKKIKIYLDTSVINHLFAEDALHIAISTAYEIDALISWNYRHLANIYKERKITSFNINEGYAHTLRICTPMEVMYEND